MSDIALKLAAPFDPALVSWRVGPTTGDKSKGMALAYIDARDVMRRLDEVCGPEGWQDEYPWSDGKRVVCRIGIKILISDPANPDRQYEWVWKTDGAGDTDTEGEKGALSDAFKRAAVKWGVGRYLYDVDTPWVQIEKRGNSYIIPDGERSKLVNVLRRQFTAAAPNGKATLTPTEQAAFPNERERRAKAATEEKKRIVEALGIATTPELIDKIIAENAAHLDEIKTLHEPSYTVVMALAGRLKTDMYAETG